MSLILSKVLPGIQLPQTWNQIDWASVFAEIDWASVFAEVVSLR